MQVLIEDSDSESASSESVCPMEDVDTSSEKTHRSTGDRIILQLFVFLLLWQTAFKVSTAAIHNILKFLKFFVTAIGKAYNSDQLTALVGAIPVTKTTICKALGLNKYKIYRKYVVCSKCSSVYDLNFCLSDLSTTNKVCPYVQFPNHPQKSRRQTCGGHLLHKMQLKSRTVYRPIKAYPYRSIRDSLSLLASRPGFLQSCEQWRTRPNFAQHGYVSDVYDGGVWQSFLESGFLKAPFNYLLTLNVDWFQPFEHSIYSIGAIYLTIQNLPRVIRNHPDNILLVGLIPGPHEPKYTINSFLTPLVQELEEAWTTGIAVKCPNGVETVVRLALSCVACDIPAAKKVLGFLGIRSILACNKCLKRFVQIRHDGEIWTNYSGFDCSSWTPRSDEKFVCDCVTSFTMENCTTQSHVRAMESEIGGRYSILMKLTYFKPVKFSVVDPMHNLFLGTAKHMLKVWIESEVLSKDHLATLEKQICSFVTPDGIGRLPSNIGSNFGGFTADQWKNWTLIYSPILLRGMIGDEHWRCWMLFVKACSIYISRLLRLTAAEEANERMVAFCKMFQRLHGEKACTMNMHLHMHLKECIVDYGATNGFWLYAFERYNGILGSFHTNNRSVECQLMEKFTEQQLISCTSELNIYDEDFLHTLPNQLPAYQNSSLETSNIVLVAELPFAPIQISPDLYVSYAKQIKPIPPYQERFLASSSHEMLLQVLQLIFGPSASCPKAYLQFGRISLGDDLLGSCLPRCSRNSSVIVANWQLNDSEDEHKKLIGQIQYFMKVSVLFPNTTTVTEPLKVIFAFVHWFRHHHMYSQWFGSSATVCESALPKIVNKYSYMPIHKIIGRCAHITTKLCFDQGLPEEVLVACHIPLRLRY